VYGIIGTCTLAHQSVYYLRVKLLWHEAWMEVPGYEVPEGGVLIEVAAAVPLLRVENASGRLTRRPRRKAAVFLLTDGPSSTLRKARTKRDEPRFTGDFWTSVVLGELIPSGHRVIALASRVPPGSQQLVIHRNLVKHVADAFSPDDLQCLAYRLLNKADVLTRLCRQSFLYSGMEPPMELVRLLEEELQPSDARSAPLGRITEILRPPKSDRKAANTVLQLGSAPDSAGIRVAVLGAGDYTRTEIIPALRKAGLSLYAVANREPQIAAMVGREYGFALATTDSERAIAEMPAPGLVVVATAHDSHTQLACAALKAGHRVFVEKPPTVTPEDVHRLAAGMRSNPGSVEIGFNRRYHPLVRRARARLLRESGATSISCTVKELVFEPDHWYFWPNQGTRITGNLCHWIDLAIFLLEGGPMPVSLALSPRIPGSEIGSDEERVLTVSFEDGSLLTVLATTRGDDIRGVQEQIDIRRGRTTITIDDLWKLRIRSGGIERYSRTLFRDKAHTTMYREALGRVVAGRPSVYPVRDMIVVSAIQIAASDLARTDQRVGELPDWLSTAGQELSR
jgi:predicted dehydrogenase